MASRSKRFIDGLAVFVGVAIVIILAAAVLLGGFLLLRYMWGLV